MKTILSLVLCFLSTICNSKEVEQYAYKVISDVYDASIPKGKFQLEGKVKNDDGYSLAACSIMIVKTEKNIGKSNQKGYFTVRVGVDVMEIMFAKKGYKSSYFEGYDTKDQHRIKIEIYLISRQKQREIPAEKPVVYCYTDKALDVALNLKTSDPLSFSYPAFSEGNTWQFKAEPNALLKTDKGTEVPYLFWESKTDGTVDLKRTNKQLEGEILTGTAVFSFLESTLTNLGLNAQEKTDFITYWGPRMASQNYVFVQFLQDQSCVQFASYEVTPAPESFNRIFLVFSSFTEFPTFLNPVKQELSPMKRKGFYLVEWGGIEYPAENLRNVN